MDRSIAGRARVRMLAAVLLSLSLLAPAVTTAGVATPVDPAWSALIAQDAADGIRDIDAGAFSLIVRPGPDGFPGDTFIGQHCRFLVAIRPSDDTWRGSVELTARATHARVRVLTERLVPGMVGEVVVIPDDTDVARTVRVTITARHGEVVISKVRELTVWPERSTDESWAREILGRFLPWLEARYPALGITPETRFSATVARPHWLIVMRYVFISTDWEVGVQWHVMAEPDDWAQLYLRHRWTGLRPAIAAEITSVLRGDRPHAIVPTSELYR